MKRFFIAFAVLAAAIAGAQQDQTSAAPEPEGAVPRQMEALNKYAGTWTGRMTLNVPGQESQAWDMTVVEEAYAGGTYHKMSYVMKAANEPDFVGTMMTGWDRTRGKYHAWTFDSAASTPREEFGELTANKLVMVSLPQGGMVTRTTYARNADGSCTLTIEQKNGGAGGMQQQVEPTAETWTVIGEAKLARKA
ncbi:MAG: hypothetical protein QOJ65_339 [Fimbriimonadaceae bacterium]|jgi:hypothetical protein|nr:hypothetical protein [Fimbriimonadaceae bacterium]